MGTALLRSIKQTNRSYTYIGDTITYTITCTNIGSATAINIILTDLIPQGANFIPNSITVDGTALSGVDPALGITLPTLPVGSLTTVTFSALVVNIPVVNAMLNTAQLDYQYDASTTTIPNLTSVSDNSNTVATTISNPLLVTNKSVSPTSFTVGTTLTYAISVTNYGPNTASKLSIIDTIPTGTVFVPNSVKADGSPLFGLDPTPPTGMLLGNLPAGFGATITFQVVVTSLPSPPTLANSADITYNFAVDPTGSIIQAVRTSTNTTTITSGFADLSGITKSVSPSYATCGDTMTYTFALPNSGIYTATNVILYDTLPTGTSFIPGTVAINNVATAYTLPAIPVGTIPPSTTTTVTFQVLIHC